MKKNVFILFFFFCISFHLGVEGKEKSYKYKLAICAIFQNEAPYMKEWIEFHRLLGVEHFFLYNDKSEDHYMEVLQPYINEGVVDLFQCAPKKSCLLVDHDEMQGKAYMDCIKKNKNTIEWIIFIDLDEFIFPTKDNNLYHFLKAYKKHPALIVHWQLFGTSNLEKIPKDKLMIEVLTKQSEINFSKNRYIKSIVQPSKVHKFFNPHYFIYKNKKKAVNSDFQKVQSYESPRIIVDKIRINHYYTRDKEHFFNVKLPRRIKILGSDYDEWLKEIELMNEVENFEIQRFVPELRRVMGL